MKAVLAKDAKDNFSGSLGGGILYVLILPVYLLLLSFVMNIFNIESAYHWLPFVVNAVCFLIVGAILGNSYDFTEHHFLIHEVINKKDYYKYFLDPVGKTEKEVTALVYAKYKENGYKKKHIIRVIIYMVIGLGIIVAACFISSKLVSSLITYPLIFISALIFTNTPAFLASTYLDEVESEWEKRLCPKCHAICRRKEDTDFENSETLYTYTTNVTDKITDGYNTAYVERTVQRLGVKSTSSWTENYYCEKCKSHFSKKQSNTSRVS